jgi:hypothetical protein
VLNPLACRGACGLEGLEGMFLVHGDGLPEGFEGEVLKTQLLMVSVSSRLWDGTLCIEGDV